MVNWSNIPPEFIETNSTPYQKHSMETKFYVYNYLEKKPNKSEGIRELSEELSLSEVRVKKIYYSIKD